MCQNTLDQRRSWFRFFPDGSLEFVVVTRTLALLLMLLLPIVKGTQRPAVFLALCGMLWIDYLLTLYWVIQLATDVSDVSAKPPCGGTEPSASRLGAFILATLPATLAFALVAPWPEVMLQAGSARQAAGRFVLPLLALASVVSLLPAFRKLRSLALGPAVWGFMILVPLLHWLGIHRLLKHLDRRISGALPSKPAPDDAGLRASAAAADALWILTVLPWLLLIALTAAADGGMFGAHRIISACGALLFGLYSVADLAAMEKVQRRFVQLIRGL